MVSRYVRADTPLEEILGIAAFSQQRKIEEGGNFNYNHTLAVAKNSKHYKMFCLHFDQVEGWVATINPAKVKPERRAALIAFQKNCWSILHNAYNPASSIEGLEAGVLAQLSGKLDVLDARMQQERNDRLAQAEMERAERQAQHDQLIAVTTAQRIELDDLQQFISLFISTDDKVVLSGLIAEVAVFEDVTKSAVIGRLRSTFGTAGVYNTPVSRQMINYLRNILGRGIHIVKP